MKLNNSNKQKCNILELYKRCKFYKENFQNKLNYNLKIQFYYMLYYMNKIIINLFKDCISYYLKINAHY